MAPARAPTEGDSTTLGGTGTCNLTGQDRLDLQEGQSRELEESLFSVKRLVEDALQGLINSKPRATSPLQRGAYQHKNAVAMAMITMPTHLPQQVINYICFETHRERRLGAGREDLTSHQPHQRNSQYKNRNGFRQSRPQPQERPPTEGSK